MLKIKINKKEHRKNIILKELNINKLKYSKNLCDRFINIGDLELNDVISNVNNVQVIESNRLYNLLVKLSENKLTYNSDIPVFKHYIKYGGNVDDVIKKGKMELILAEKTNFLDLIKKHDHETAYELALNKIGKTKINIIRFD